MFPLGVAQTNRAVPSRRRTSGFILKDQMVSKSIPCQFRDQAVVLMRILAIVSEDQIGGDSLFQLFEELVDLCSHEWHESIRESLQRWTAQTRGADEKLGCMLRFRLPNCGAAKHHPMKRGFRVLLGQTKNRSAATYLDIVSMGA
jgi:hypothetical protein